MVGDEWSSNKPFTFDKGDLGGTGPSGTAATSLSIIPAKNGELIIGNIVNYSGTLTASGSYSTGAFISATHQSLQEYQTQTTAASITATATVSSGFAYGAHVIAIQ